MLILGMKTKGAMQMLLGCNHALNILHFKDGRKRVQSVPLPLEIYKEFFLLNQALTCCQLWTLVVVLKRESGQY